MVNYVDYTYYTEEYGGTAIPSSSFDLLARKATLYMKKFTFRRIPDDNVPDCVKLACCEMCEAITTFNDNQVAGKTVKSESNDGYSVTFVTEQEGQPSENALARKLYAIAQLYLAGTELMNMGCEYDIKHVYNDL